MVNKKGFLRIVEATIAIMIIVGVMLVLVSEREVRESRDLTELLPPYLDEIAQNVEYRRLITETYNTEISHEAASNALVLDSIEGFLDTKIQNPLYRYELRVCDLDMTCPLIPYPRTDVDIFAAERAVSASIGSGDYAPKKLKIFLWQDI